MGDIFMQFCPRCVADVTHERDASGHGVCLRCQGGQATARPAHQAISFQQPPPPQPGGGGFITGTIKLAGFVVSAIFLVSVGTCVYVCGSAATTTRKYEPPVVTPPQVDNTRRVPPGTARQREIVDGLNGLLRPSGAGDALVADEALVIDPTKRGDCDEKTLRDLRKAMAALDLDPTSAFTSMRCAGGAELKLR